MINKFLDDNNFFAESERITLSGIAKEEYSEFLKADMGIAEVPDDFVESSWKRLRMNDDLTLTVGDKETGEYVGYVMLQDPEDEFPEIAIAIAPERREQGYGYENVKLFTDTLREKYDISVFTVSIRADNIASQNLFKKFDLREIGDDCAIFEDLSAKIEKTFGNSGEHVRELLKNKIDNEDYLVRYRLFA